MSKHADSIDSLVLSTARKMKSGNIFTPSDLAACGSRTAVAQALSRHVRSGELRQPARGLYQVPQRDALLGELQPTPDQIARALAGKDNLKTQPSGAYAANLLGLSEQVPQRIIYLTDGYPRQVRFGAQQIVLRRTTPRNMATAGRVSGLVIQALRHIGQRHVDRSMIEKLRRRLGPKERAQLLKDVAFAPAWVGVFMREIAAGKEG